MVIPGPVRLTINTDSHQLLMEMNTLRQDFAVPVTRLPPFRGSPWFSTLGNMERRGLRIQPSYYLRPGRGPPASPLAEWWQTREPTHRPAASPPMQCSQDRVGCADLDFSR